MVPQELIAQVESATARMTIAVREQMDKGDFRSAWRIVALQTKLIEAIDGYNLESQSDVNAG